MALVRVRDLLNEAQKNNTAVIAFDALDYNTIYSCIMGAEKARRPVIMMLYPAMSSIIGFRSYAEIVCELAEQVSVPVGLHLDHCSERDTILAAIRNGFTSVMADGSGMPLRENIAFTKAIVDLARIFDVDVEGELGHVGQATAGCDYSDKSTFTLPEEAKRFAEETGVTSLAVAFGSSHGLYKVAPDLDLERLQKINAETDVPLVLHGGSGIPAEQLEKAFRMGINKLNVATEFFLLYEKVQYEYYTKQFRKGSQFEKYSFVRSHLIDYVANKLQLCTMEV